MNIPDEINLGLSDADATPAKKYDRLFQVHPNGSNKGLLSSRMYEYFCTQYIKQHTCLHNGVDLHCSFRQAQGKRKFAFFCREQQGPCFEVQALSLNVPMLNFLDWVATYRVDEYISGHQDDIKASRAARQKQHDSDQSGDSIGTDVGGGKEGARVRNVPDFVVPESQRHTTTGDADIDDDGASIKSVRYNLPALSRRSFKKSIK